MPPAWHKTSVLLLLQLPFLFFLLLAPRSLALALPARHGAALCKSSHCTLSDSWCQCRSPRNGKAVFRLRAAADDLLGGGGSGGVTYVFKCPPSEEFHPELDVAPFGISLHDGR